MRIATLLPSLLTLPLLAAPGGFRNAHLKTVVTNGSLRGQLEAIGTGWATYEVPILAGQHSICCFDESTSGKGAVCRLDGNHSFGVSDRDNRQALASDALTLVYRISGRRISDIRAFSADCPIDAGGASVVQLSGVTSRASIDLLTTVAMSGEREEHAMVAMAFHGDPLATERLGFILRDPSQSLERREHAAFWLANARGHEGYEVVRDVARSKATPSKLREKAVFALTQSKDPGAVDAIIAIAHSDPDSHVRGEALFWLAQSAGKKAVASLKNAIDNDPDAYVKEHAVFALSQLPDDESIPMLIDLVHTNHSREVRRKAVFWLGQKNDPRALAAIESLLKE